MSRKDQVVKIINGELPDYTPYHFDLTMRMTDRLGEHYGYDREGVEDYIGNHLLYLDPDGPNGEPNGFRGESADGTTYFDEFGTEWDVEGNYEIGDWGMVDYPVKNLDFSDYTFPRGKGKRRFDSAKKTMQEYTDRFNVMRITGPMNIGWYIIGFDNLFMGMPTEPDKIHYLLENTTQYIVDLIERIPEGVDGVRMIEDWGVQKGLMFSEEMWMEFIYPCYEKIWSAAKEKGLYCMQHTCGDVTDLFPQMIELGVDIIDAIQPESMDIQFLKDNYGDDIVLFGGLGSQSTIPLGTPEEVVEDAARTLGILGKNGKYLFGPAGSIPSDAPIENVVALVEFCKDMQKNGWIDRVSK